MATLGNKRSPFPSLGQYGYKSGIDAVFEMTIGASGAISSQAQLNKGGVTAVKTATKTGRYTLTLPSAFRRFFGAIVTITGPTDAIFGANTVGGPTWFIRNNNIDRGTKAGTVDLQFCDSVNNADAELPSGCVVNVILKLGQGV